MISRRSMMGSAAAFAMTAVGAKAAQADKLRIGLIPINDVAPIPVGIKKGFFAAEGIEIEVVPSTSGAVGIPAIVGGALDITYGNTVSSVLAAAQGLDVKIVGVTLEGAGDGTAILARKESNITSGKDLVGKTLGVNARNNIIWLYAREWIAATGGDPTKVNFREIAFPQMPDALNQKQIDAVMQLEPFRSRMLDNQDIVEVSKPYNYVQPGAQIGNYVASGTLVRDKKDVLDRFLRALDKSNDFFSRNLRDDFVISTISEYTKASKEVVLLAAPRPALPGISVEQMTKTAALMRKHGLLQKDVDVSQIVYKR